MKVEKISLSKNIQESSDTNKLIVRALSVGIHELKTLENEFKIRFLDGEEIVASDLDNYLNKSKEAIDFLKTEMIKSQINDR